MKIKTQYDKIEDIPENHRDLFTEKDGKFVLSEVEGLRTQVDIDKINEALRKEKKDHRETKDKFASFADLDLDDVLAKLDRFPELEAAAGGKIDDAKLDELVENRLRVKLAPIERENAKLKTQIDGLTSENTEYKGRETQRKIYDAVRAAATASNVRPEAMEDILFYGERVLEVTDDGQVVTKDNIGMTPGIAADVMLTELQPKRPHWWPESAGGGSRGNNGHNNSFGSKNPWSATAWNLTEQGKVFRENPTRAEQMAKSAGTTIGGLKPATK